MALTVVNFARAALGGTKVDTQSAAIFLAAVLLIVMQMDITHLLSMIVGAAGYLLLQAMPKARRSKAAPAAATATPHGTGAATSARPNLQWRCRADRVPNPSADAAATQQTSIGFPRGSCKPGTPPSSSVLHASQWPAAQPAPKLEVRKPSAMPVHAPVFNTAGLEAEVNELLSRIIPTPESEAAVANIARAIQRIIRPVLPEAEVLGFASANPMSGTAFGVAVPEVDIVVNVNAQAAQGRLQDRWAAGSGNRLPSAKLDSHKVHKSAIRACTDRLVASGAFKFRRSAFRSQEPKVTLIALPTDAFGVAGEEMAAHRSGGMPINVSVNAMTPLRCAALLTEVGMMDARAKPLILLVRRWAKDRGISHAAKNHLSPYCWTLLTIFYLQAGLQQEEGGAILPALTSFEATSAPAAGKAVTEVASAAATVAAGHKPMASNPSCQKQLGELFHGFIRFYAKQFDWGKEAVSVRRGSRGPAPVTLPLHIVLHENHSTTEVGPSIEDPFDIRSNLGACTNALSLARLREELERAHDFCESGASLSKLLDPWAPPDAETPAAAEDEE